MNIFQLFKKAITKTNTSHNNNINNPISQSNVPKLDNHVLVFVNGLLKSCDNIPIYSYNENYYTSTNYIIDGKFYNLCSINDIASIPNYSTRTESYDITKQLEYLLYMASGELEKNNMLNQAIECLRKSNKLKLSSSFNYSYEDYMKICEKMVEKGMFEDAQKELEYLKSVKPELFSRKIYQKQLIDKCIENARSAGSDLLKMSSHSSACKLCSQFQGKVFSISGKNKNYPRLPETVRAIGSIHVGCRHIFNTFFEEYENKVHQNVAAINKLVDKLDSQNINYDKLFEEYDIDHKYNDRIEYYRLFYKYPELAPKSFNSYRRMKSNKTSGYLSLIEKLKNIDIEFYNNYFN